MIRIIKQLLAVSALLCTTLAHGHSLNDSYLELKLDGRELLGMLKVAVVDLEIAVGVDDNEDSQVTWGEIRQSSYRINDYIHNRLQLRRADQDCEFSLGNYRIEQLGGGAYLQIPLSGLCPVESGIVDLDYELLFDVDSSHRGIIVISADEQASTFVLAPDRRIAQLQPQAGQWLVSFANFTREGIWHIWIGFDHILFLLAMLLGVVLHQRRVIGEAALSWQHSGLEIVQLVTAFTIAHSITLIMATLQWVILSPRLVEAAIALSVVLGGLNILVPLFGRRHWQFAFAFGLIHGFGFANVLAELHLSTGQFVTTLLGFNIGVELGQLLIVLVAVPVLFLLTHQQGMRRISASASGLVITNIGVVWFLERTL